MNDIIPWDALIQLLYDKGKRCRTPRGIETRMYPVQIRFSLSDKGVEDAICDSDPLRKFVGIDFPEEQVPDAITLLHFLAFVGEKSSGARDI